MTSGLVFLSSAVRYCYPFVESITSFLPVVDEMVVVNNPYGGDTTREVLEDRFENLRIVSGAFFLRSWGRVAYGNVRTLGYQACKGDVVVMFDADGILHENDQQKLRGYIDEMRHSDDIVHYHFGKYRFYKPERYIPQGKHQGVYDKGRLGDRFDFYGETRGNPNCTRFKPNEHAKTLDVKIYGYEHIWDTLDIARERAINYMTMIAKQTKQPIKDADTYWNDYISGMRDGIEKKGAHMPIDQQPGVIREKLRSVRKEHMGYNLFT